MRVPILTASAWPDMNDVALVVCIAEGPLECEVPESLSVTEIGVWPKISRLLSFGLRLRAIVRERGLTTLVSNGYGLNQMVLLARTVGLMRGVQVVVAEHSTLSVDLQNHFRSGMARTAVLVLTRWLYRHADAIVGVSDGVSRDLEATLGFPHGSVTTIYNPVDADRITEAIDEPVAVHLKADFSGLTRPVVITTGRLALEKAQHDLLDAFAMLSESQRGSLVILGDGPLRQQLERQAQDLGIAERVWMPGFVDNPWWFMARSDVFVLSSHWEGFGLVLVEALVCGVPVASTDCPSGPREILEDVPNARLTPVGDSAALADAIVDLLALPRDSTARPDMKRFLPAEVAARYQDIVIEVAR